MISDLLRRAADERGDSIFLRFLDRSVSFGAMDERSGRAASLLRELGVRRGDKACLAISNRPEFLELWFGLAKLGAIMVPVDPSLDESAFAYVASHSDATVLVLEDAAERLAGPACSLPAIRKKIWIGGNRGAPPGFLNYHATVASMPRTSSGFPSADASDIMAIVYTPGTAGIPKGAILSQSHYGLSGRIWAEHVVRAGAGDVFHTTLPLSRVWTQTSAVLGALVSGCQLVLGREFDPPSFLDELRRYGATVFGYRRSMIESLLGLPARADDRENPARLAFGDSLTGIVRRDFEGRFGIRLVEGFQLTECAGACLATSGRNPKEGSIGKPLPCFDVTVVDDFDEEMPTGLSGEIVLRPRMPGAIFLGYYREHDRTAENMRNDWFHTGDRGYADTDGDFFFLDRKMDCIRRGGEFYSSLEIERTVNLHPGVLESAATGVVSELVDEDVRLFVVPRPGMPLSPGDIIAWCSDHMASGPVPRYVELVPMLPKTAAGGIRKNELRKRPVPECHPAGHFR